MPGVLLGAEKTGDFPTWSAALEKGIDVGLQKVAENIRDVARSALNTATDPWGAAFAPPSPMTIRLRAIEIEDTGRLADSLMTIKRSTRKWTVMPRGKKYIAGHLMQFGSESKQVFDNARAVTQPPRPFLPIRGDTAELPADLEATVSQVVRQGISEALVKEGIQDSQRAQRAIRRR